MMTEDQFARYLVSAYEGEVGGHAYFNRLAACYEDSGQSQKLECLARLEKRTAEWLRPVLTRYGFKACPDEESSALGIEAANTDSTKTWCELITHFRDDYAPYIAEFEALEAAGADADRLALCALTQHEVAIVEFAKRELAAVQPSQQPVESLLAEWR